jgi:CubicO group peptidase (beta-lactamase class C family)
VSGKPFPEFTREQIFAPLGMTSTQWRDDFQRIVRNRAVAYSPSDNTFRQDMLFEDVFGNWGLLTTVGDLLRWNRNFTDAKVGGRGFVDSEHQKGRLRDGRTIRLCRRIDGPALEGTERGQPQRQHGGISGVAAMLSGAGPFGHRALQRLVGQRDRARASSRRGLSGKCDPAACT